MKRLTHIAAVAISVALPLAAVPASAFAAPPKASPPAEGSAGAGSDAEAAPPSVAPEPTAPAPHQHQPSTWENLDGGDVTLELKDESSVAGSVVGVAGTNLLVARDADRRVVAVPTQQVRTVHVRFEPKGRSILHLRDPAPGKPATGLLVGGGVMVGLGATFLLAGVMTGVFVPFLVYFVTIPVGGLGAAAIGAGIPMLVEGKRRRAANLRLAADDVPTLSGFTLARF